MHKQGATLLEQKNVEKIARMERIAMAHRTVGDRVADAFARTIGSWKFIIIMSMLLCAWVVLNVTAYIEHWDPVPFILLNLMLSFQAAYASPIIMMSQNRQAKLADRRNHLDLQVNLLAEQENTEMLRLLRAIARKLEVQTSEVEAKLEDALSEETNLETLLTQIEKRLEN